MIQQQPPIRQQEEGWRKLYLHSFYLIFAVFFMSTSNIAITYSRHGEPSYPYIPTTINVLSECSKFSISIVLFIYERYISKTTETSIFLTPIKSIKFLIPSILYAIKNVLSFYMLLYISPAMAEVIGQIKIPMNSILMWLILSTSFSKYQWLAVIFVCVGAAQTQLKCEQNMGKATPWGIILSVIGAFISSLAGVYTEKLLKEPNKNKEIVDGVNPETDSLNVQNIHQYFYGMVVSSIIMIAHDGNEIKRRGFFDGYSTDIVLVVIPLVFAGLFISIIMKQINNVARVFAHTSSIIVVILLSIWIFGYGAEFSDTFIFATVIILLGFILYRLEDIHLPTFEFSTHYLDSSVLRRNWTSFLWKLRSYKNNNNKIQQVRPVSENLHLGEDDTNFVITDDEEDNNNTDKDDLLLKDNKNKQANDV